MANVAVNKKDAERAEIMKTAAKKMIDTMDTEECLKTMPKIMNMMGGKTEYMEKMMEK